MKTENSKCRQAFTLIELLVVVAVIAILAAIALPNFLAAQTRAKVSRSRADMRTVVTALESYRVDWNGYPTYHYANAMHGALEFHLGGKVTTWPLPDSDWNGANPLTTPVAYITTMPDDSFATQFRGDAPEVNEYLYVNWLYAIKTVGWPIFQDTLSTYGPYRLHSRGPDLDGPDSGLPYDATNGIKSDGDITYGPHTGFDRFTNYPWREDGTD